ncbi:MAG: class I mannose-6-phosphate isomerase [Terrimicrobiaceae bacterium]|nr:class I mannose-6-phosphate isomerase [Terrimicrobiaceae bacterium]
MPFTEPILFEPLPMERVWGGRRLESLLGKSLPPGVPVGESWEIVDREDAQSVAHGGARGGATLHELWAESREEIFGAAYARHPAPRFPILIKLLDARERLSVQVHPPAGIAPALQGEPKTEMWYFLDCLPGATIYAGLKRGVTRASFEEAMLGGEVEQTLHRIPVRSGESIFIPSGRVHAIGEGCLIVEVQQNSDTTYRVFDWNRAGLDGNPRALHIAESMSSIDFEDYEPAVEAGGGEDAVVAGCEHFLVERWMLDEARAALDGGFFALFAVVAGRVRFGEKIFEVGAFFLVPAGAAGRDLHPLGGRAGVLRITLPLPRRG